MKKTSLIAVLSLFSIMPQAQNMKPAIPRDADLENKIEQTLSRMTLDEKVGQMLELNVDAFGNTKSQNPPVWEVNEAAIDTVISKYKVGSFLNAPATT